MTVEEKYKRLNMAQTQISLAQRGLADVTAAFAAEKTMLERIRTQLATLSEDLEVLARLFYLCREECVECARFKSLENDRNIYVVKTAKRIIN